MSCEIVSSITALARTDPAEWAGRVSRLGLLQGAGTSLRASQPGWADATVDPAHAAVLLSHPEADPQDNMRCFRNATFGARLTIIARNGTIGCHALHDEGAQAVCDDLSAPVWNVLKTRSA